MSRCLVSLLFYCCCLLPASGQELRKEDFLIADNYAREAGPMHDMNLGTIVDSLTQRCNATQEQLVRELQVSRTFFYWLARNIAFDCKAWHHPKQDAASASAALTDRKATSEGFARLFKAMCDLAHIPCEVISGVYRFRPEDIGKFDPEARQFWNIIQIENTKFLIDASLGGGSTDDAVRRIIPEYTDAWWLSTRMSFALSHFPDNSSDQLLEIPLTRTEFTQAPLVHPAAIAINILPGRKLKGILRGREDTSEVIRCTALFPEKIRSVNLSYDNNAPVPATFNADEFGLQITIPYGEAGEHIVTVLVGDKKVFTFRTAARKVAGRQKP